MDGEKSLLRWVIDNYRQTASYITIILIIDTNFYAKIKCAQRECEEEKYDWWAKYFNFKNAGIACIAREVNLKLHMRTSCTIYAYECASLLLMTTFYTFSSLIQAEIFLVPCKSNYSIYFGNFDTLFITKWTISQVNSSWTWTLEDMFNENILRFILKAVDIILFTTVILVNNGKISVKLSWKKILVKKIGIPKIWLEWMTMMSNFNREIA